MKQPSREIAKEIWKSIAGYSPDYEVSNLGRVRRITVKNRSVYKELEEPIIIKPLRTNEGYFRLSLWKDGKHKTFFVHRLVLLTFIGTPLPGQQAAHLDGNCGNNALENLTWATIVENYAHKYIHGTVPSGERNGFSKLTDAKVRIIREKYKHGHRMANIAKEFSVSHSTVSLIVKGKRWAHVT